MRREEKIYGLKNENLPVFPTVISYGDEDFTGMPIINQKHCYGLTKREYLISQAFKGHIVRHGVVDFTEEDVHRILKAVDLLIESM